MESMDYYKFQRHASKTAFDLLSVLMNKKKDFTNKSVAYDCALVQDNTVGWDKHVSTC